MAVKLLDITLINLLLNCVPMWEIRYSDILERVELCFLKRLLLLTNNTPHHFEMKQMHSAYTILNV